MIERADPSNFNYEEDMRYTVKIHKYILGLIGVWPLIGNSQQWKRLLKILDRAICCFLISFNLIPWLLYMILIMDTFKRRVKMCGALCFYSMVPTMYCLLILRQDRIRECVRHVEEDWRNVNSVNDRKIMLNKARTGRIIFTCTTLFLLASGFIFRLLQPIIRGKSIVSDNVTIRPLVHNMYFIFFDSQQSPAYEIVFSVHLVAGALVYIVAASVCGITALFTMHACGQLEMLVTWLENLSNKSQWSKDCTVARRLATIVAHHVRIRRFLNQMQDIVGEMCLVEIAGSTLILCLLLYYVLTGWESDDSLSTLMYTIMLTSFTFNIFILCYIGEILSTQGTKLNITCCTLDWYRLPNNDARCLILIIAMANYPTKLTASKVIDLSYSSFGAVIRTAVAYLNLLRTVTM